MHPPVNPTAHREVQRRIREAGNIVDRDILWRLKVDGSSAELQQEPCRSPLYISDVSPSIM